MSKKSKIVVVVLFVLTLALAGAAIFVSNSLDSVSDINPDDSSAAGPCRIAGASGVGQGCSVVEQYNKQCVNGTQIYDQHTCVGIGCSDNGSDCCGEWQNEQTGLTGGTCSTTGGGSSSGSGGSSSSGGSGGPSTCTDPQCGQSCTDSGVWAQTGKAAGELCCGGGTLECSSGICNANPNTIGVCEPAGACSVPCQGGPSAIYAFQSCPTNFCADGLAGGCAEAAINLGCYQTTFECVVGGSCGDRPGCQDCPAPGVCSDSNGDGLGVCVGSEYNCSEWVKFTCPGDLSGQNCTLNREVCPNGQPCEFTQPFCGSQQIDCNIGDAPPMGLISNDCGGDAGGGTPGGPGDDGGGDGIADTINLSGNVICDDGTAVQGANILIVNQSQNLSTDSAGNFSTTVPEGAGIAVRITSLPGDLAGNAYTAVNCTPGVGYNQCQACGGGTTSYEMCLNLNNSISGLNFVVQDCAPEEAPRCGDGTCNGSGEMCDGSDQCVGNGILSAGECRAPGSTNECTYCGDGIVQESANEECDDGNSINDDSCDNSCRFVAITPECGDDACDAGETCDGTAQCSGGGVFTPGECRSSCTYCGDGVVQTGEACDDGNTIDDDDCSNSCTVPTVVTQVCGDGILQPGEECDSAMQGSCGPGATCNPNGCVCEPIVPGLCGSACTNDFECPVDNVCYGGTCMLAQCGPGFAGVLSGPVSGGVAGSSYICTNNGCDIVVCGDTCGAGGQCPTGLTCGPGDVCMIPYCVNGNCADVCELPPTALFGEELDMLIFAALLIILGILAHRFDIGYKFLESVDTFQATKFGSVVCSIVGVNIVRRLLDTYQRVVNRDGYEEKSKKNFEDKFDE
ncbi:DUF4215 domain-containing protein [Candidatus Dojkabacteria bacterium]|uniref:DUF4215 domain-containing protein n=1 Tax=Candidatus Dojkabacteria bacterium TaxID=2099670 RepID=A0A955L7B4_9BACT|nr:DUF4215 domain-containing protein [Candidatus Dojkabacteria bacterium]